MGREIRRVSPDWEHPRDGKGHYKSLYDETFTNAMKEWQEGCATWQTKPESDCSYEEWNGPVPDPEYYRPEWVREPSCYQVYETVSKGTPTSPVFVSLEEMQTWLIEQGFSMKAAAVFAETGYAPTMIFVPGVGVSGLGIHSLDFP